MEGNEMKKRVLSILMISAVFSCLLLNDFNVFATDLNLSKNKVSTDSEISEESLKTDMHNWSSSNLIKVQDVEEGVFLSQIEDSIKNSDGERSTNESFWEVEPNNTTDNADHIGEFGFGFSEAMIFGTIGESTTDIDIFSFLPHTTGELEIYGFWMGYLAEFGLEDDLVIGLFDSEKNLVAMSYEIGANGSYAAYLYYPNVTRDQMWYIAVMADTSVYQYLYDYEEYGLVVEFTQTSKPASIKIDKLPLRINYLYGEPLVTDGGEFSVVYDDGSIGWDYLTPEMVIGYNPIPEVFGPQELVVAYDYVWTTFTVYVDRFSDVPYGHRNYVHINALVGLGIINGYSDNTFRPSNTLTRAQAAIMIVRAIGLSTEGVSSSFTDVPPTHAAYKFISAAYQAGIINGYSDGTFRPNANVTRAQIAIMVQRAFNIQASGTTVSFTDVPEGYAPKKFIETLASQKIVNGYSDGTFKPLNNVTRAQFSTMIYNAIQYAQKQLDQ
jgi:hypothetical protein